MADIELPGHETVFETRRFSAHIQLQPSASLDRPIDQHSVVYRAFGRTVSREDFLALFKVTSK